MKHGDGFKLRKALSLLLIIQWIVSLNEPIYAKGSCTGPLSEVVAKDRSNKPNQNARLIKIVELTQKYRVAVEGRLGPYSDPFGATDSFDEKIRIYHAFSRRFNAQGQPIKFIDSAGKPTFLTPAGQLRELLIQLPFQPHPVLDEKLIEIVIADAHQVLSETKSSKDDLFSVLLALRQTDEYLRRFVVPEKEVDRDGKEIPPQEGKKQEQEQQPSPQKQKQKNKDEAKEQPQEYPELPESYDPFTKDTKQEGASGSEKKIVVAEYNGTTHYFKLRNFNTVLRHGSQRFQPGSIPGLNLAVGPFDHSSHKLTVYTAGKTKMPLYHVPGYDLLQPLDSRSRVTLDETGAYVLETNSESVEIPMRPTLPEIMNPEALDYLTRPVGFQRHEFPLKMQRLFERLKGKNAADVSQEVSKFIRKEYLYSVGPRPEKDPIEAFKAGAFQCDIAAFAMVGILRDIFRIPSRIAGGFRSKQRIDGVTKSTYLVYPGDGHAWVEAFVDGKWLTFDPTPTTKDSPEEKKGGEENEWKDVFDPHSQAEQPAQDQDRKDSDKKPSGSGQAGKDKTKDHKKRIEEDSQKRIDEARKAVGQKSSGKDGQSNGGLPGQGQQGPSSESSGGSKDGHHGQGKEGGQGKEAGQGKGEWDADDLIRTLDTGAISLGKKKNQRNPFIERAFRVLLREALNPSRQRGDNLEKLSRLMPALRKEGLTELVNTVAEAGKSLSEFKNGSVAELLESLRNQVRTQDVNQTFAKLQSTIKQLEYFSQTLDYKGKLNPPSALLRSLYHIRDRLMSLGTGHGMEIAVVNDFMKNLPPISRSLIKSRYALSEVGPNVATSKLYQDLKEGKVTDFKLIATLSPYTDFILDSTPTPEYVQARTYLTDRKRITGQDIVTVERPGEIYRGVRMQPHKSAWENFREGSVYNQKVRQRVLIPRGFGTSDDVERMTIVAYDTSGSMEGEPGDFQAGLIAAFVDRALSDVSPSGRVRHKALLMGFDDRVHTTIPVRDNTEAKNVIRNYRQKLVNTRNGTNIEVAILRALGAIAEAQRKNGEPLKKANIIIMTDGQSAIDFEMLRKARAAIDRRTPVEIMFVGINQSNPELVDFATKSAKSGFNKGFYREFTSDHIGELMKESRKVKALSPEEAFHSQVKAQDIPMDIVHGLDETSSFARSYASHMMMQDRPREPLMWHNQLETVRQPEVNSVDRPIEDWLDGYRGLLYSASIFKDNRNRNLVVDDTLSNLMGITGVSLSGLSLKELESIRHMLREAARL